MLIKEFTKGKTRIKIYDDAVVQTKEEVEKILNRCAKIAAQNERTGEKS